MNINMLHKKVTIRIVMSRVFVLGGRRGSDNKRRP